MWGPQLASFRLQKFRLQGQTSGSGGWVKNCRDNDVGDESIVEGLLAITKTMRIQACLSRGKFKFYLIMVFPPYKRILWIQKILRLWQMRIYGKFSSWGQTKLLIVIYERPIFTFSYTITWLTVNRERAPWATIVLTTYFCGCYWQFSLLGKNSLRLEMQCIVSL